MTAGPALILILSWITLAVVIGTYAERKGYSALLFTVISLVASPLVGIVIALLIEDKRPPTIAVPPAPPSRAEELGRLAELRERGALTDEEFAQEKARLLGQSGARG